MASVDYTDARNVVQELLDAASSGPLTRPREPPGRPRCLSSDRDGPGLRPPARSPRGPGTKHDPPRAGLARRRPPDPGRLRRPGGRRASQRLRRLYRGRRGRGGGRRPPAPRGRGRQAAGAAGRRRLGRAAAPTRRGPGDDRGGPAPPRVFHPPGRGAGRGGAGRRGQRRRRLPRHRPDRRPQPPPARART